MDWTNLLNEGRRKQSPTSGAETTPAGSEHRTEIERDFDRILFSAPVRRLADKTQVFPLERNDSVRNRLTHSHEVSNLGRSIGVALANNGIAKEAGPTRLRDIPALLGAVGLAHDLGNPPFGHQGEEAIQGWIENNQKKLFRPEDKLTQEMKDDFLKFEGNAQTFRLLTKLQVVNDDYGLNLTYATLAAAMKYPTGSSSVHKARVATKKHGFFQSEKKVVEDVWKQTGLQEGLRHPLTYVMEASDDAAYSVLDVEDGVKKGLVSFPDVVAFLTHNAGSDEVLERVICSSKRDHEQYRKIGLSPAELNEISMQKFRVYALGEIVTGAINAFKTNESALLQGDMADDLIEKSSGKKLCSLLKKFSRQHVYSSEAVLNIELTGHATITKLMEMLWFAIHDREDPDDKSSRRLTPFSTYAYQRISENYRRVFEAENQEFPIRYQELLLLTDMVSGMTDSFALSFCEELRPFFDEIPGEHAQPI